MRRGSAARKTRRLRPFPRLGRGVKFAKMLRLFKALPLWRTSLRPHKLNTYEPARVRIFLLRRRRRKRANPCGIKSFCARTDPDTYLFKGVCKSMLPQGSAACAARRFRPFPRLGRGVKFAKILPIQSSILMANIPPSLDLGGM